MKRIKINLDRPYVDSKSIQTQKDFNGLMNNHALMTKPFYKSPWFLGATGLASVTLVVGGVVAFQDPPEAVPDQLVTASEMLFVEPVANEIKSTAPGADHIDKLQNSELTLSYTNQNQNQNQNKLNDKTSTLNTSDNQLKTEKINNDKPIIDEKIVEVVEQKEEKLKFENVDVNPRIGGKINGAISKNELFDTKGITTESDVSVIHFELHLLDGLGGKVFQEEGNQLNDEMRAALKKINSGETIYFENIKGKTEKGDIVRLNPLRYVLMN